MYLSQFGVKNYKCLGDIDIPLTPIHVLIGQNDCGKTSLLEAMAALCASSERKLAELFPEPWIGRELVRHGSPESQIDLWGEWKKQANDDPAIPYAIFRYGMSVGFPRPDRAYTNSDQWLETDGNKRKIPEHPYRRGNDEQTTLYTCKQYPGEIPSALTSTDMAAISNVLKLPHKYSLDAKLMAVPAAIDPIRKFRLDPDGFGLATLLDDILGFSAELFIRMRDEFCRYFPQFKSVQVQSVPALHRGYDPEGLHSSKQTTGKGIYFETVSGQTVRAQQASDGAILFLAFLALAHLPDPPNLLLIEEPENGIYPRRLGEVVALLKQLVNRTEGVRFPQIILTTHSPYVLSFFQPEQVTLLSRASDAPDAPVHARPLRDAPNIRERMGSEFYLGELWYNLSEGELFGDAV